MVIVQMEKSKQIQDIFRGGVSRTYWGLDVEGMGKRESRLTRWMVVVVY